jgi:tetratricopeptide (TPR) repeat protein
MKKREPLRRKDNVIIFPDLEKRLTEKGLESLQKKKYVEAVHFFEQAKDMEPENTDTLIGLVLAYFEAGLLKDARELSKDMLYRGIGDYFQMVDLYIMILIQLNEYEEVVQTIEALLEEREIPSEKSDHFTTILQFSKKMVENKPVEDVPDPRDMLKTEFIPQELNLFTYQDPKEQMLLVARLSNQNVRPYIHDIKAYLASISGHPFLKTMLLNVLKEQEYDRKVEVSKLGLIREFIPSELPDIQSQEKKTMITDRLRDLLESDDPVLFENIKSLVERHFFLTFPFELEPEDIGAWAAAYHYIALEYYGMNASAIHLTDQYETSNQNFEKARAVLQEIEEISYPII